MNKNLGWIIVVVLCLGAITAQPAQGGNDFGVCLTDSLNGKERKTLAKWIFLGMAAHPDIATYSRATKDDERKTHQFVGKLVTRLLTEDCVVQARQAFEQEGAAAFERAFSLVGQVAMQELMTDAGVSASIAGFEKFLDQEKINEAIQ